MNHGLIVFKSTTLENFCLTHGTEFRNIINNGKRIRKKITIQIPINYNKIPKILEIAQYSTYLYATIRKIIS